MNPHGGHGVPYLKVVLAPAGRLAVRASASRDTLNTLSCIALLLASFASAGESPKSGPAPRRPSEERKSHTTGPWPPRGGLLGHPSRGCLSRQSLPPSQKLTKGRWDGETRPGTFSESLNSEDAFGGSPRDSTVPGATPPSQGPGSCTVHTGGHPPESWPRPALLTSPRTRKAAEGRSSQFRHEPRSSLTDGRLWVPWRHLRSP